MRTFLLAAAALALCAGSALAQDKPAGAMSTSGMSSSMSTSAKPAKPMSKKDMKAMDACHKMDADAMAKSAKCQKLMGKPMTDAAMPMKK
jgi:hypothetical protein